MQIITAKVGEEVRLKNQCGSEAPIAIVADACDGEVTLVVRDSNADLAFGMHQLATSEQRMLAARRIVARRIERRVESRKRKKYA